MDEDIKILIDKINNNIQLNENEIQELLWECEYIDQWEGEDHRWDREIFTIIKFENQYFEIPWRKGLTEYQENTYWDQPFEVFPRTYQKTVTIREWITNDGTMVGNIME